MIGLSFDESEKLAKTVLALMIAPLMEQPAFVARLIPMVLLKVVHDTVKCNQIMYSERNMT